MKSNTGNIDEEVQLQMQARDLKINELNKLVIALRAKIKAKEENKKIQELEAKAKAFEVEMLSYKFQLDKEEKRNDELRSDYNDTIANYEKEKIRLMARIDDARGETEVNKIRLGNKRAEMNELMDDNKQLSKIVEDLTTHNKELVSKVENMLNEIDIEKRKNNELQAKMVYYVESEKTLESYMQKQIHQEKKNSKLLKSMEKIKIFLQTIENVENSIKDLEENIKKRAYALTNIRPERVATELPQISRSLQEIVKQSEEIRQTLKTSAPYDIFLDPTDEEASARQRVVELEQELIKIDLSFRQVRAEENTKQQEIDNAKTIMERHKKEHVEWQNHMKNKLIIYKQRIQDLKDKLEENRKEVEKKEFDIQRDLFKIENLNSKIEILSRKNNEVLQREEEFRNHIANTKARIVALIEEKHSQESSLNVREKKVAKSTMVLQALKQEMFKKDTEVLKKNKEIVKLEAELEKMKSSVQRFHSQAKLAEGEVLTRLSREIEERDQKIEMLKEMLRGTQSEVKSKDTKLTIMKRKIDDSSEF